MARLREGPSFFNLFLYLPVVLCCFTSVICANRELDENNWRDILEGEWMVKFYAPWCPACTALKPAWKELSEIASRESLALKTASVDVTKSPGLSGRFIVTALPTIFHVHEGTFRPYKGPRDAAAMAALAREGRWRQTEPLAAWKRPDSLLMGLVAEFFKLSQGLRSIHTTLMETYGLPTWGSYLIFAVGTILIGSLLGLLLVCLIDMLYPPKPRTVIQKGVDPGARGDEAKRSDDEELLQEDIVDESNSDPERYSPSDSSEEDSAKQSASEERAGDARRRRPRKAD